MSHLLRSPWFWIGFTLLSLGFGNWYTGLDKTREYEGLLKAHEQPSAGSSVDEFPELSAHMNTTLLRPLQRSGGGFTMVAGKLDFYRLVRSGGEMMMLAGLFVVVAATIHTAYTRLGLRAHS